MADFGLREILIICTAYTAKIINLLQVVVQIQEQGLYWHFQVRELFAASFLMLKDLEMPVKSEVACLNVLLTESQCAFKNFQSTSTWKFFQMTCACEACSEKFSATSYITKFVVPICNPAFKYSSLLTKSF